MLTYHLWPVLLSVQVEEGCDTWTQARPWKGSLVSLVYAPLQNSNKIKSQYIKKKKNSKFLSVSNLNFD